MPIKPRERKTPIRSGVDYGIATVFQACPPGEARGQNGPTSKAKRGLGGKAMTLGQACPPEYRRAQYAFKDSMIHGILQFTLLIAFCCVLHRCRNQEIHC